MGKTIKYIGTRDRWPELSITGKQSQWRPGQTDERSDAEAELLMSTGFFEGVIYPAGADPVRGGLYALPGGVPSSVSGAGNAAVVTIAAPDGYDVGDVLTATPSTGWTVSGYQWTRDGVDISGAISSTYTLTSADGGKLIGCRAVSAVYSALASIPSYAPTLPAGYLSLDSSVLSLDSSVLSLV